jgi:hypothetical protein
MTITCPTCGFTGTPLDFHTSLADECFCPAGEGCEWFLLRSEGDEDGDEDPSEARA